MSLDIKNLLHDINEARILGLRSVLDEYYPQDIAEDFKDLNSEEKALLFDVLSIEQGAAVLVELEKTHVVKLLDDLSDERISKLANQMQADDAADILAYLDDKRMLNILERIQRPELKELMSFETDTCGGIMTPEFISIRADLKVSSALRYVRLKAKQNAKQIIYVYVTKKFGELVGVISLTDLFRAPDEDTVDQHMNEEVIFVNATDDQEVVADLISKYRFLAIPVINVEKQIVGIITIDDVVDVIEEEATEDIYQSSGINVESETNTKSLMSGYLSSYKARTPWLLVTLIGQYLAATIIAKFNVIIAAAPIAISFMPLLSGLSGNIGSQSTVIVVRGLYIGDIDENKSIKIFIHELVVSVCIGLTCAILTGFISFFVYDNLTLSLLIASSLVVSMMLSVGLGTLTPIVFKKVNLDPAAASGPLITTAIDIIAFSVYLSLITKFIDKLV